MKTFAYLSEIQDLIRANLESKNEKLAKHAQTLIVPRTHGSTTDKSIMDGFGWSSLYMISSPAVMPGCQAYGFKSDMAITGRLGAISLDEFKRRFPGEWPTGQYGVHGAELYHHISSSEFPFTYEFTVIIGEFEGELAVFTWHPGEPLAPGVDMNNPLTAVKLI